MSSVFPSNLQKQFVKMVEQHRGIIYKIVNAYCKDSEEQKDLAQEIIFQLWRSFGNYSTEFKKSTWIYRIALNVAISNLRKDQVRKKYHTDFDRHFIHISAEENEDLSEELSLLRQFIRNQKRLDKAILLLYLDGKKHAEIAEVLGVSTSNVGTKLARLKARIKDHLIEKLNDRN